jgi:hypothetical protein
MGHSRRVLYHEASRWAATSLLGPYTSPTLMKISPRKVLSS